MEPFVPRFPYPATESVRRRWETLLESLGEWIFRNCFPEKDFRITEKVYFVFETKLRALLF